MNGTIYEEIKKNGNSKKKEKLKVGVTIILTNLLVALLCLSFGSKNALPVDRITKTKITHPFYKMISIPLNVLIDIDQSSTETPVTLMTKSKKILIYKAYLHEILPSSIKELDGPARFKIEIPEAEVLKLSAEGSEVMIAIPEIKLDEKIKKTINPRVSKYEINL